MKHTALVRRTPLKRAGRLLSRPAEPGGYSTLKRSALKASGAEMKRAPWHPARKRATPARLAAIETAFERDDRQCQWPLRAEERGIEVPAHLRQCFGGLSPHEPGGRGRVDIENPENITPCCNFHNEAVESHPDLARALGLRPENRESAPLRKSRAVGAFSQAEIEQTAP